MDVIDFLVDWKSLIGQTVTVTGCSLRHATMSFVACSAGSQGELVVDSHTLAREDLRRSLRSCAGFEESDECHADVTGNVTEAEVLGPELKSASMKWAATSAAPQLPREAPPSSQAPTVVDATERIRGEIAAYAATKGETSQEFSQRIGSSLERITAIVFATEHLGGTSLDALTGLENFSQALKDPDKRTFIQCLGVHLTEDPHEPTPSEAECAALKQRLNLSP